jgi:hypothetical protein
MASFPTSLPNISNPTGSDYLNSPAHATQHSTVNDEVTAVATKIGTGASTPTDGKYLKGSGTGTSAWATLTINRAFGFYIAGYPTVANDLSWQPTAPAAMTATKIWASCKTAPTGANLIARVYNITQSKVVASVTITATETSGNNETMTEDAITAGDILRADISQIGSTVAGADISIVLECTA